MRRAGGDGQTAVAFGSFLAPAACLMWFVGERLVALYLGAVLAPPLMHVARMQFARRVGARNAVETRTPDDNSFGYSQLIQERMRRSAPHRWHACCEIAARGKLYLH